MFYNDAKKKAISNLRSAEEEFKNIAEKGNHAAIELYETRKSASHAINRVEKYINTLANTPKKYKDEIGDVVYRIREFREAIKIEEENNSNNIKGFGLAAGGTVAGGAIAALGPTAAMAIATTFGTASTGTAIASLTGAAATKAALAWLGGGALAAGGGGMAAGNALLSLAGPIGWGIAGALTIGGGVFAAFKNKSAAEKANNIARDTLIKTEKVKIYVNTLEKLIELTNKYKSLISITEFNLAPTDYLLFNEEQKLKLASIINNTKSLGELINERIDENTTIKSVDNLSDKYDYKKMVAIGDL